MVFNNRKAFVARFSLILTLLVGMLGVAPTHSVHAATYTVTNTTDSSTGSLRHAIAVAAPGDIITFDSSLAGGVIQLSSPLSINKDLTIDGSDLSPQITLSGENVTGIMQINFFAQVTISDLTFTKGSPSGRAIEISGASTLTVFSSTFTDNAGGAIANTAGGTLTVLNSTFLRNSTDGDGAAIYSSGRLTVENSTIDQNQAVGDGGAIAIVGNSSSHTIVNSTITQNQAGVGGAISIQGNPYVYVVNSTLADNNATQGSQLYMIGNGGVSLYNTFVVCRPDNSSCIVQTGTFSIDNVNSVIGTGTLSDFGLAELADNGGPTQTMALLPGSSLIDAGADTNCPATDQRGVARPQGAHCDIGAYEYQPVIYYVKWNASGANNGTSWMDAYTDLQSALAVAPKGDEIWVAAGTYKPTIGTNRTVTFQLKNGVAIYGGFAGTETIRDQRDLAANITILSGDIGIADDSSDNSYHVVTASGTDTTAVLNGFTVTAGHANGPLISQWRGGGMYNDQGSPSVVNTIFDANWADASGGGMANYYSNPSLTNVTFTSNSATDFGGGMDNSNSSPNLTNVTFSNNVDTDFGGGMSNFNSNPNLTDVIFSGNSANRWGGGMHNNNSKPNLMNVTFTGNSASHGGGMYNHNGGNPSLTDVSFSTNSATWGGGMYNFGSSSPTLTNVTFQENTAYAGGGIYNYQNSLTLTTGNFNRNTSSADGAGMYNQQSENLSLTDVTFSGNIATQGRGGGIFNYSDNATLTGVTFIGNEARDGGGMYNSTSSNPTLIDVTFNSNKANSSGRGGGMYNNSSSPSLTNVIFINNSALEGGGMENFNYSNPTLTNVTFKENTSVRSGGGMINFDYSSPILTNVTFSGNTASIGGGLMNWNSSSPSVTNATFNANSANDWGGGMYNDNGSIPNLKNVTFSGNLAGEGGGMYNAYGSDPIITNSILYGNSGGEIFDVSGTRIVTYSIVQGGYSGTGSLDVDPFLGPLQDNGGFTQTMALGMGSPAIDAGDDVNCPSTDQRGVTRPQGSQCDIGAFEYEGPFPSTPTPSPTSTPTNTPTLTPTATQTPTNTPTPTFTPTYTPTATFTPTATPSYSYNPLYLSLTGNQTIGGVASADEDILRFDGTNWSLFFDGSDVGVGSLDLFAFSIVDGDTILMSFNNSITLSGLAIAPQDVVQFDATSLGSTTAGTFSMYLDGSDMGLDISAEKIDSVSLLPDGRVLISTTGNPAVVGVTGARDEDVLAFSPTSLGNNSSGTWGMYFDGSDVGLAETSGEDVDALDVAAGKVYLSTTDNFAVNGLSGADEDVFVCEPTSLGDVTACNYLSTLYFDGSTWGLSANDVDAFNFLTVGPIPTSTPTNIPTNTPSPTFTHTPSPTFTSTRTPTNTTTPPTSMFIQITQPNGGEVLTVGSTYRITWNSTSDIDKVTIGYKSCDSCLDWIANNIPNVGYYDWNVNVGNTTNTQFKIDITGYDTGVGSVIDRSDNFFTVLKPTPTPSITATPTPTHTPDASDLIFADGFESGNLSAWTSSSIDAGDLSISSVAALVGSQGLQAMIDDNNSIYLTDDRPNAEVRYRARFYFDPNSIVMTSGDAYFLFKGFAATPTDVLQVELRNSSGAYQLRAKVLNDSSAFVNTNWFTISDAFHFIELDWTAATATGANNGGLTLWIDGIQQADLTGVDNDTWRIDWARLGAVAGVDTGTRGTIYFDAFESRRQTYIGP